MVLLVKEMSTGKKTKGLAVTYRAGVNDKFGTCPADCKLNPSGRGCGMKEIDFDCFRISKINPIYPYS